MARKWQRLVGIKRKEISLPRMNHKVKVADKGHFVVYTIDKGRFVIPLAYLRSKIFRELFRMSKEQFGLPNDGPITLPCDADFLEYVVSLVQKHVSTDLENAVQLIASFVFGSNCLCLAPSLAV
ncbi:auxin-responsive protein SAUR64-like [Gastrolobium bilobum]|uniref:auxin-responsive protein SAUR64-like n=1 Tax=Gastrolobium bilobum TaxID=150636 RepID=UPI002AAFEE60|nr:auxin-responsive protein SAUR64-like [Gastrolobium bilobum]